MKIDLGMIVAFVVALFGIGGFIGAHRLRAAHKQRQAERERIRREEAQAAQELTDKRVERLGRAAEEHAEIKARLAEAAGEEKPTVEDWEALRERIRAVRRWREDRDE